jgi:hypothetical protein
VLSSPDSISQVRYRFSRTGGYNAGSIGARYSTQNPLRPMGIRQTFDRTQTATCGDCSLPVSHIWDVEHPGTFRSKAILL